MKHKKLLLAVLPLYLLSGCKNNSYAIKGISLIHELEFGGVYLTKTIDEFNKIGYAYGDSVDIAFSNGFLLEDLPYYNGYYVDAGTPLLVGYPGYDYIKAAINYGDDMWEVAHLSEGDTGTITLHEKAKYLDIQNASDIHYYDEREKYSSDEEFANFRNVRVGNIKEGVLYRSASPCDNKHNRASYTDRLMEQAGVRFILNLADTKEKIDGYIAAPDFNSPYFLSLYRNELLFLAASNEEHIEPLAMNMNYRSEDFAKKLGQGLKRMASSSGPILIHCLEGKDRTGFVLIVLEALLGATYQEIVDDYMLTYQNYYGIDRDDPRYEILKARNVDAMLSFITNDQIDITKDPLVKGAKDYLLFAGLKAEEIETIIARLQG